MDCNHICVQCHQLLHKTYFSCVQYTGNKFLVLHDACRAEYDIRFEQQKRIMDVEREWLILHPKPIIRFGDLTPAGKQLVPFPAGSLVWENMPNAEMFFATPAKLAALKDWLIENRQIKAETKKKWNAIP